MTKLAPSGVDLNRYWVSIGACLLFTGIHFQPTAQRILSSPIFNFLGRCSFPVYLLHDQIMRTILVWMIYGGSEVIEDDEGNIQPLERGGYMTFCIAIPIYYVCLYFIAWQWMLHVEPQFARSVLWLKKKAWREETDTMSSKVPAYSEKLSGLV